MIVGVENLKDEFCVEAVASLQVHVALKLRGLGESLVEAED